MKNQMQIGELISKYRKLKELSQTDLADLLIVSFQTISKWERGEVLPDVVTLGKIAEILQFDPIIFFKDDEDLEKYQRVSRKNQHSTFSEPSSFNKYTNNLDEDSIEDTEPELADEETIGVNLKDLEKDLEDLDNINNLDKDEIKDYTNNIKFAQDNPDVEPKSKIIENPTYPKEEQPKKEKTTGSTIRDEINQFTVDVNILASKIQNKVTDLIKNVAFPSYGKHENVIFTSAQNLDKDVRCNALKNCVFKGAVLDGTNFQSSSLNDCTFHDTQLLGVRFSSCKSSSVNLNNTILTNTSIRSSKIQDTKVKDSSFTESSISSSFASDIVISVTTFNGFEVKTSNVSNVRVDTSVFKNTEYSNCNFTDVVYNNSTFTTCLFDNNRFSDVKFINCVLENSFFKGNLKKTEFINCEMDEFTRKIILNKGGIIK